MRRPGFARLVRSEPTLLARDGSFCPAAMRRARVTEDEVLSALRAGGGRGVGDAAFVILESDGTLSVGLRKAPAPRSA